MLKRKGKNERVVGGKRDRRRVENDYTRFAIELRASRGAAANFFGNFCAPLWTARDEKGAFDYLKNVAFAAPASDRA